jgi:ABC-2 type transport system ATP-binding protein
MTTPLIEVEKLTHRYGKTLAVDDLSFGVQAGEVYGLLGHNGAGKTTTIKALLGLLRPQSGRASVLGLDAWKNGVEIRRRVGYVPEDLHAYDWMTVKETLWFVSQFHPTWDTALQEESARRLELPLGKKLKELSRGTTAKVALLCATAFHPEALILDDPTSGIDAVVRRAFLVHVIEIASEGGKAVLFSSHVLDEVERLADRVGIVVGGRKVLDRPVDELKSSFRRVTATYSADAPPISLPGSLSCERSGRVATLVVDGWTPQAEAAVRATGAGDVKAEPLSLEDIFVEVVHASKRRGGVEAGA